MRICYLVVTFTKYIALSEYDRVERLWKDGIFVMNLGHENHIISLYVLYGFYVEIYMDLQVSKILDVIIFEKGKRLDKYIEQINLNINPPGRSGSAQ